MITSKKIVKIKSFFISTIVMIFFCFSFQPAFAQIGHGSGDYPISGEYIIYGENGKYIIRKVDTVLYRTYISGKLIGTVVPDDKKKNTPIVGKAKGPLCKFIYQDSNGKRQEVILPCKE